MVLSTLEVSPTWFFGIDSAFEFVSAMIAMFIGYYALKVRKATHKEDYLLLSNAFFAISFALVVRSLVGFASYAGIVDAASLVYDSAVLVYVLFMLTGFGLLTKLTLGLKNGASLLFAFIISIVLLRIYAGYVFFYIGSVVLLLYAVNFFFINYRKNHSRYALLVLASFALILLSQIFFAAILLTNVFYVVGHAVRLAGFLILFCNIYLISKAGKRKL